MVSYCSASNIVDVPNSSGGGDHGGDLTVLHPHLCIGITGAFLLAYGWHCLEY